MSPSVPGDLVQYTFEWLLNGTVVQMEQLPVRNDSAIVDIENILYQDVLANYTYIEEVGRGFVL